MNKKTIVIDKLNSGPLQAFIKKLISIDKFIYLKLEDGNIVSNVYLPDHDATKQQIIPIGTLFEMDDSQISDNIYKISFYNGNRVIDALKTFGLESIKGEISFAATDAGWIATSFIISNLTDTDSIKLPCADPAINFMDLTNEQLNVIYDDSDKFYELTIDEDVINKLESKLNLEKENDTFKIECKDNQIWFNSSAGTFQMLVAPAAEISEPESVQIYKRYLSLLDNETYICSVCHNKLILISNDSETKMSIATCQTD